MLGVVPQQALPRVVEAVREVGPRVIAELQFSPGDGGVPEIHGQVTAQVTVTCERCLEPMALAVRAAPALGLVRGDTEAESLPARLDPCVLAEEELDLFELIEEEILLALPIVAAHADTSCQPRLADAGQASGKESPFRVLERLKPQR